MKILSWNVNGIRAILNKGFVDWVIKEQPDILCLQETKAQEEQLPDELKNIPGYVSYFSSAERKGYSGVALYTKIKPANIQKGFGPANGGERFDKEGRTIIADFGDFILFNHYVPNGGMSDERLQFKLDFYDTLLDFLNKIKNSGKNIIVTGDINTAHKEIDIHNPQEFQHVSGFLPVERQWIDKLVASGFVDTFRMFNNEPGHYTWWDYRQYARSKNLGWRLDYIFVSENIKNKIHSSFILSDVKGSDHCPVGVEFYIS